MTITRSAEAHILDATVQSLSEQGYDVLVEPSASLLPYSLRPFRPDGIAIGRKPKLIIEVAREGPEDAQRVAKIQGALKELPDWRLHLVFASGTRTPDIALTEERNIAETVDRAIRLADIETSAALLMVWAALEALGRNRRPIDFAKPQSPGRIVERMAMEGMITASEASFLRDMALKRNAFIHGDLSQATTQDDVRKFAAIIRDLLAQPTMQAPANDALN